MQLNSLVVGDEARIESEMSASLRNNTFRSIRYRLNELKKFGFYWF